MYSYNVQIFNAQGFVELYFLKFYNQANIIFFSLQAYFWLPSFCDFQ